MPQLEFEQLAQTLGDMRTIHEISLCLPSGLCMEELESSVWPNFSRTRLIGTSLLMQASTREQPMLAAHRAIGY
jgi:hypothetical protein